MIPQVAIPDKLIDVFTGDARYRGAFGGRGSAKTRTFAKMSAVRALQLSESGKTGVIVCGREFMNSLDDSSFAEVKAAIESEDWLLERFALGDKYIRTKDKRIDFVFCGLRHNLGSIKSKAKIHLLWVDEAEPVSEHAWQIIIPTVREEDSELWITWNPERKNSATNLRFKEDPPEGSKIVEMNWRDNPKFPAVLEQERQEDLKKRPESYDHIWEGAYKTHIEGAYYAKQLLDAREEKRIGKLSADPLMTHYAFWDIGGTGIKADACAIWIAQFIGKEIRIIDYYEAVGQTLAEHVCWLRENKYESAYCVLPHDGANHEKVERVTYQSALRDAGFATEVVLNQGAGAAFSRVAAGRRLFPSMWFDSERCEAGLDALGWYHERRDENRNVGLGPEHDWSSHSADAFGLMCVYHETMYTDKLTQHRRKPRERSNWRT